MQIGANEYDRVEAENQANLSSVATQAYPPHQQQLLEGEPMEGMRYDTRRWRTMWPRNLAWSHI